MDPNWEAKIRFIIIIIIIILNSQAFFFKKKPKFKVTGVDNELYDVTVASASLGTSATNCH